MNSLKNFSERLKEIKTINNMFVKIQPINKKQRDRISVLTRASVVMLCGHIEGYLEEVINEFVNNLCDNKVASEKIPHKLKEKYIKKDFNKCFDDYNQKDIKKSFLDYNKLWENGHNLNQGDIDGHCITEDFNNPHPEKIKNLFSQIGLSDILAGEKLKKYIPNIESLVEKRHKIVHGDINETATPNDVEIYAEAAIYLARAVAKEVKKHLKYKYKILL